MKRKRFFYTTIFALYVFSLTSYSSHIIITFSYGFFLKPACLYILAISLKSELRNFGLSYEDARPLPFSVLDVSEESTPTQKEDEIEEKTTKRARSFGMQRRGTSSRKERVTRGWLMGNVVNLLQLRL
jgi:hypothetical protein